MEENFEKPEQLDNYENIEKAKPNKPKKLVKKSFITLSLIIVFGGLWLISMFIIRLVRVYFQFGSNKFWIVIIFSLLISLVTEILIVYLIILRRTRNLGGDYRLKRHLKISLFILLPFLFIITFAFLTVAGGIPNRFNIETLEGDYCGAKKKYSWEDGECHQKCENSCKYGDYCPHGWSCSEECDLMCEVPKYENCIAKCKNPKIEGYNIENYNLWYEQQPLKNSEYSILSYYGNYDIVLMHEDGYDKWINENFSGHIEELKSYESCLSKCGDAPSYTISYKPIIYLYPTTETQVNVKLGTPENLLHTYPKYNSEKGRNVIAQPNGDLEDIDTGRKLYALYREGKSDNETDFNEGFVVAGKDIIPFLEEKLAILGLNEREAEEFIVYRLPQMENNEWNLIRFETIEEQNENMPLNVTPIPDTVIRVMMDWKAIDEPTDIPEQQLITPERNGFTVVEWGGSPRN